MNKVQQVEMKWFKRVACKSTIIIVILRKKWEIPRSLSHGVKGLFM